MNFVHPPSESRLAARAVALHAGGSPAEQKELLAMLGLLSDDGQLQELPAFVIPAYNIDGSVETRPDPVCYKQPPWDRSSVPPGLRNLAPPVKAPAPPRPRPKRVAVVSGCGEQRGTVNGRNRHRREGSPVCDDCRQAWNEYQRALRQTASAPNPDLPPRPEKCGTLAGRSNHVRRGEELCRACKDAANAHARARRAQRKEAA
jgi:hypothetical protein